MRYLSVCSGIEAASVAWTPLGVVTLFTVKADPEVAQFVAVQSLLSLVAGIMCAKLKVEIDDE
ncbi:MAG TPA: hypothetical protein VG894_03105 [Bauldia sp.]|nr:hypothetical protein [Bauldia sp.]